MITGALIGLILASAITLAIGNLSVTDITHEMTDRSWHVVHASNRIAGLVQMISLWILFGAIGALAGHLLS